LRSRTSALTREREVVVVEVEDRAGVLRTALGEGG
jgi:hypothetical protein